MKITATYLYFLSVGAQVHGQQPSFPDLDSIHLPGIHVDADGIGLPEINLGFGKRPGDPLANNCGVELEQCLESKASENEAAERLVECYIGQVMHCRGRTEQAEQEFANQLNACSSEKTVINNQLY
ncbi:hypothetical protein DM02DRAFT_658695 [Periconia macrospinosa]|uniref:Uncharacterized protein n=1 Tax=Periconia macrospinosa TaxID=97972 RepID=A0A2V1DG02_9PLEO|nr:hypothetical protein DM02DRAFT_658695 [Periconia macrospinosa]